MAGAAACGVVLAGGAVSGRAGTPFAATATCGAAGFAGAEGAGTGPWLFFAGPETTGGGTTGPALGAGASFTSAAAVPWSGAGADGGVAEAGSL